MDFGRKNYRDVPLKSKDQDDLLIFGYSCKLFRDDEKATSIDQGEHLIPWMGEDDSLMDRFDVRGALYDLKDAESIALDLQLTKAELMEEQVCFHESYQDALYDEHGEEIQFKNGEEMQLQQEDMKRLQVELASNGSGYKQVSFNYAATVADPQAASQDVQLQQPISYNPITEDVFIPPEGITIPDGMDIPKTTKQHEIILRTAKFIASQGPAQGTQMEVLIKTKQAGSPMFNFLSFDNLLNAYYKYFVTLIKTGRYRCKDESAERDENYLHPNLPTVQPDLTPGVLKSSKPSPHCAYTKLITKIREKQKASVVDDAELYSPSMPSSPVAAKIDNNTQPTLINTNHSTPLIAGSTLPKVGLVDYPSFNHAADDGSDLDDSYQSHSTKNSPTKSENANNPDYSKMKWPNPTLQMVIDKMACYIIKNGPAFQELVCNRNDSRFEFMKEGHEYYPYFQCKIQLYNEVYGDAFKISPKDSKKCSTTANSNSFSKTTSSGRAISFSIKSRETEAPLTSHTTFPIESSTSEDDEDMDEEEKEKRRVDREQRRRLRKKKEEKERREREETLKRERIKRIEEREKLEKSMDEDDDSSGNEDLYDIFKYAQEMENDDSSSTKTDLPSQHKQLERKRKAAAFISKLKDGRDDKQSGGLPVFGPQLPNNMGAAVIYLKVSPQSSSPSKKDLSDEEKSLSKSTSPNENNQPSVSPGQESSSPLGWTEALSSNIDMLSETRQKRKNVSPSSQQSHYSGPSMSSVLMEGLRDEVDNDQDRGRTNRLQEVHTHRSRSHKKISRQRSESRSPSSRRDRKKRKKSHSYSHRRKKHRSRSKSRDRSSKSHRSQHKKKSRKHSSHKDKSKRRKKHHKHRSPSVSSVTTLSSDSSNSSLPSDSDEEVQVINPPCDTKASSRSSSIVSLPEVKSFAKASSSSNGSSTDGTQTKIELLLSGSDENSLTKPHASLSLITPDENTTSSIDVPVERTIFNPSTSSAMAKITEGLRAKLNAMLEKKA